MGAFFLSETGNANLGRVEKLFQLKGFKTPMRFKLNNRTLLLYQKQVFPEPNYYLEGENAIFVTGTLIYKGLTYSNSLKQIFTDFLRNQFDPSRLLGNYFILFKLDNQLFYFIDPSGNYSVYKSQDNKILSSSFMAVIKSMTCKMELNKLAVTELLVTGNLIGPETIFNGIERIEPSIDSFIPGLIELKNSSWSYSQFEKIPKFDEDFQINKLKSFVSDLKNSFIEYGALTGLTGGLDSRLLFLLFDSVKSPVSPYSTWRKKITAEFACAEALAKSAGYELRTIRHRSIDEIPENELKGLLHSNLLFNDGIIRTHQIWLEEIKGRDYLLELLGDHKINISGVGGEQYRNSEYLMGSCYNFNEWVNSEVLFRYVPDDTILSDGREEIIRRVKKKIARILGLPEDINQIDAFSVKRYYNEIYNPANRTVRNNIENQLYLFLSPFTEYSVSRMAYLSFPHLGNGPDFQKNMINKVRPDLSNLKTDYGYAINERVPLKIRMVPFIKKYLGLKRYRYLEVSFLKSKSNSLNRILAFHPWLSESVDLVRGLNLPVDFGVLSRNEFLYPLILELGLLLKEFEADVRSY